MSDFSNINNYLLALSKQLSFYGRYRFYIYLFICVVTVVYLEKSLTFSQKKFITFLRCEYYHLFESIKNCFNADFKEGDEKIDDAAVNLVGFIVFLLVFVVIIYMVLYTVFLNQYKIYISYYYDIIFFLLYLSYLYFLWSFEMVLSGKGFYLKDVCDNNGDV